MIEKRVIALDWDGTLIDHPPNISFTETLTYGPIPGAVKVLNYLANSGIEFYVLTARGDHELERIKKWIKRHGFPKMEVTNKKRPATMFVDDRAVRFTNWTDISKLIK